jgi:AcrR family transcriptional regulator
VTTKERILNTALELYNKSGPETVTVRHIAAKMGISHGNLCYHFPNTEAIVRALYGELVGEMNKMVTDSKPEFGHDMKAVLQMVLNSARRGFETLYRYRFVLLNFHAIMRSDEYIRNNYSELTRQRQTEFRMITDALIHAGIFRPESYPGQYDLLIELQLLAGDNWIARAEIIRKMNKTQAITYYTDVLLSPWTAIMTEPGMKMYRELSGK